MMKDVLKAALKAGGFVCLFLMASISNSIAAKPNFLIVIADDMGWADLGFLGSKIKTPNLDALAAQGVFMTSCG